VSSGHLSQEVVHAQVERICDSAAFSRSPRLQRLLRYLALESAAGRADGLKEYAVGVAVFDRGGGFDPRLDPIVRVEVRRLRAKLAAYYESQGSSDAVRIEVPTGGYEAFFREAPPLASAPADAPALAEPTWAGGSNAGARRLAAVGAVLVIVAAVGGLWGRSRGAAPPPAGPPAAAGRPASIAVLPLAPIGADPLVAAFSDGLTQDIITQLAGVRGLRIIARTSVNRYRGSPVPIRVIAGELGVQVVLEGSVRREGGRIRITAQLIDGASERHLWARSYDRTYENTLAIQGEVAHAVTEALALRLSPDEKQSLLESGTTNEDAHVAYLRGVHHLGVRTPAEVRKSVGWLEQAVSLDPAYGAARATLGEAYFFLALEGAGPPQLMEKTRELAEASLAVQPDLAEGHRALALVQAFHDRDWPAAEGHLRAALETGPGVSASHEAMATALLLPLGRLPEAVAEQREACLLNPLSASAVATLGRLVDLAGDEREGVRLLESAIDLEPRFARAYVQLAKLHLSRGRAAEAEVLLRKAASLAPEATSWRGALAMASVRRGRRAEAEALARELERSTDRGGPPAVPRAEAAMALGHTEAALRLLEEAAERREPWVVFLRVDPIYAPLRSEPRFAALVRRLGLSRE